MKSGDIRDLVGTLTREKGAIGVFLTLKAPSKDMGVEAAAAGLYQSPGWHKDYPRIQILTIADLLQGAEIKMPPQFGTFAQAPKAATPAAEQGTLGW